MQKIKTNRLFLIGGSSILGNSIANSFLKQNLVTKVIKITRNEKLEKIMNFYILMIMKN